MMRKSIISKAGIKMKMNSSCMAYYLIMNHYLPFLHSVKKRKRKKRYFLHWKNPNNLEKIKSGVIIANQSTKY